jgi:hypothetical protein
MTQQKKKLPFYKCVLYFHFKTNEGCHDQVAKIIATLL